MASKKSGMNLDRFKQSAMGRPVNTRSPRKFILIVCEGKETEPKYFEGLKQKLSPGVLSTCKIDVKGEGRNTTSLLKKALEAKKNAEGFGLKKVDKVWVVLDKDSFKAESFNTAIHSCTKADGTLGCAWTNEAFELWYLLHFEYYESGLSRAQYKSKIEAHFKKAGNKDFKYEKNHPKMFELLGKDRLETAIKNAKRLKKKHEGKNHADHNPCTTVHELVLELFNLEKKYGVQNAHLSSIFVASMLKP